MSNNKTETVIMKIKKELPDVILVPGRFTGRFGEVDTFEIDGEEMDFEEFIGLLKEISPKIIFYTEITEVFPRDIRNDIDDSEMELIDDNSNEKANNEDFPEEDFTTEMSEEDSVEILVGYKFTVLYENIKLIYEYILPIYTDLMEGILPDETDEFAERRESLEKIHRAITELADSLAVDKEFIKLGNVRARKWYIIEKIKEKYPDIEENPFLIRDDDYALIMDKMKKKKEELLERFTEELKNDPLFRSIRYKRDKIAYILRKSKDYPLKLTRAEAEDIISMINISDLMEDRKNLEY